MSGLFLKIVNMSISASYLALAVFFLRLILKKAPKWVSVLLWGAVAIRLICPVSVECVISLIPSTETVSPEIMMDRTPEIHTGIEALNSVINPVLLESFAPDPGVSMNPLQFWIPLAAGLWIVGVAAMLAYTTISYILLRRKVATAVLLRDNIYQSECVDSPFVLGIVKPRIYLPFQMNGQNLKHVISHEQAHIHRRDHWWKPFGFVLLALHWFNPLMWLGYILLCRDIELACDEKVIKEMDSETKAGYTEALLACSVRLPSIAACPLAFGEVGVKERVKSVMNYKRPAFWILIVAVVACIAVVLCFLTNPVSDGGKNTLNSIEQYNFKAITNDYTTVMVSDGEVHTYVGPIARNRMQELYNIQITPQEISLDRSENRDKSNTLILYHAPMEEEQFMMSYVAGTCIHFNADFSQVWVNDGEKVTLTYGVLEPEKAKTAYLHLSKMEIGNDRSSLMGAYPEYFGLDASKGLDVYVWQMAGNSYSFGLLPHSETPRDMLDPELMALNGVRADAMGEILESYQIEEDRIYIIPWQHPLSSYLPDPFIVQEGADPGAKIKAYIESIREMLHLTQ